jgi:hypothetical protein
MAPVKPAFVVSATARADLLVTLCGRNTLISFDRLMRLEAERLFNATTTSLPVISEDGTWFPEFGRLLDPIRDASALRASIEEAIANQARTQRERRQVRLALFRPDGQPRPLLRQWLGQIETTGLTEVLERYPMRPENMSVIWRYVAGRATAAEAEAAFLESLRDPSWMMRWFEEHHEKLSVLHQWVRNPARTFVERLQPDIRAMREAINRAPAGQRAALADGYWRQLEEQTVLEIATDMVSRWHPNATWPDKTGQVDKQCPGLSTAVRTVLGAVRDSIGERPRNLRKSDLVDGLHAMYVPYVDVFRADRYMAPHIRRAARELKTRIVSRVEKLPGAIEEALRDGP